MEAPDPFAKRPGRYIFLPDLQTKGRYKQKFHHNERVSQWLMHDPSIPKHDWERLEGEALSGRYGPAEGLTRSSVILITRALGLQKYRERWKSILYKLNPTFTPTTPPLSFLAWSDQTFPQLVFAFNSQFRFTMPQSVMRDKKGVTSTKPRHNFPSYNYTQRKLLEMKGIWDFHHEFPVPRSHTKLHALDDVFAQICSSLGLPFQRSAVIKIPKFKKLL
jgi:hypothetical protein